ncbi:MAG: alpha/beta hydrolase [Dehalococcoidia bacterium]
MEVDVLGGGFERMSLPMGFDDEGEVVATLVRRRCPRPTARAVLYLHGYIDYFFQTGLAEQYIDHGYNFYALDLRKYGRSLLPHQTPYFCRDIREYFPEIDTAIDLIRREEGNDRLLLNGHSTGGLIASLYAHAHRGRGTIDALFLNSPFFQFPGSWLSRDVLLPVVRSIGAVAPYRVIPRGLSDLYGRSVHRDHRGEWDYDLTWKPIAGVPLLAGWVRAIALAQQRLLAGLDIACPVLVMCSTESSNPKVWDDVLLRTDSVLDVTDISRLADRLGDIVTRIRIDGGMHDLVLSAAPVREGVYRALFTWTDAYLPARS